MPGAEGGGLGELMDVVSGAGTSLWGELEDDCDSFSVAELVLGHGMA